MSSRKKYYPYHPETPSPSTSSTPSADGLKLYRPHTLHRHLPQAAKTKLSRRTMLTLSAVGVAEALLGKVERVLGKQSPEAALAAPAEQGATKRIYIAPDDHTDYM